MKEDINYIYYKVNSNKDYYILEFQKKTEKLNLNDIKQLLTNDGFNQDDISDIFSYKYSFDEKEENRKLLNDENEILLPKDFQNSKIYLFLTDNEEQQPETDTPKGNDIDIYLSNLEQLKNEINELSKLDMNIINKKNNKKLFNSEMDQNIFIEDNFPKIYGLNQNINNKIDFSIKNKKMRISV